MNPYLILVDRADHEVGIEEKMAVHQQGLLHRAFSIFIYRKNGNTVDLLLQKRNPLKYHSGGLWTNTCCGHPSPIKNVLETAQVRLFEEMGIRDITLKAAGKFWYKAHLNNNLWEHEIDHVLIGEDNGVLFTINEEEASDFKWSPLPAVMSELKRNPEQFTVWFPKALSIMYKAMGY